MGRGGGGGGRGGGGFSGGSRGGSFRSSGGGGRGGGGGFHFSGGHHHHYTSGRYSRTYVYSGSSGPVGAIITVIVVAVFMMLMFTLVVGRSGGSITRSTIDREKLDSQYVNLSSTWFDDSAMGWISSSKVLEDGLKDFYNETGVQPYLVITDNIYGDTSPTGQEVWDYGNDVYNSMFTDEGHMVFVFQCVDGGTDYMMAAVTGAQAKTVLDDAEALEILYDYVDSYFWSDRDEDEMFADAFSDAADRIMSKQMPLTVVVIIAAVVVVALIAVVIVVKTVTKRAKEKAAETERILNTPVDKFGDKSVEDLKDMYDE